MVYLALFRPYLGQTPIDQGGPVTARMPLLLLRFCYTSPIWLRLACTFLTYEIAFCESILEKRLFYLANMKDHSGAFLTSSVLTFIVAASILLGGCTSGNIAGPQPEAQEAKTVQSSFPAGQASTNGDGTAGQADHNTSPED
jgi:hypothetical protein